MSSPDLRSFIDQKINDYSKRIAGKSDSMNELAAGELLFYTSLRSVIDKTAGKKEIGLLDAVNDTLKFLEPDKFQAGKTFYS
jgi:hypothetical protein